MEGIRINTHKLGGKVAYLQLLLRGGSEDHVPKVDRGGRYLRFRVRHLGDREAEIVAAGVVLLVEMIRVGGVSAMDEMLSKDSYGEVGRDGDLVIEDRAQLFIVA